MIDDIIVFRGPEFYLIAPPGLLLLLLIVLLLYLYHTLERRHNDSHSIVPLTSLDVQTFSWPTMSIDY